MDYNGQAAQDYFVMKCLNHKHNGTFLEIGSRHPIDINNTYLLESKYNWRGIMVEYDKSFLPLYEEHRPNSVHLMEDAQTINYADEFKKANFPNDVDYLQIDLDADNGSTINTLIAIDNQLLDTYKFATVTFEHDIYRCNTFNTRKLSREIFEKRGYYRVFSDVMNDDMPFEDWYVHPDLVDMNYILEIHSEHPLEWKTIRSRLDTPL